jgi:hypothetical protein
VADNIMAIEAGRLSLSRVTYHTNLQQATGAVIPLGVIAEMTIGKWRALGLIARTSLTGDEIELVARMLRAQISAPFDFLKHEFDWALAETSPGYALGTLAQRYSDSLFFAPPTFADIKKLIPSDVEPVVGELILPDLRKARDAEFYLMLAEQERQRDLGPSQDTTMLKHAA